MTADPGNGLRHRYARGLRCLSVPYAMLRLMARHMTFKFCLDPTVEQHETLARHAGAARFAFNQCLRIVKAALTDRRAWSDSRTGKRKGRRVGFPRFKKKTTAVPSFRLRNKHPKAGRAAIRIGDGEQPRSVTLPGFGQIAVHDDTRALRRMLAKDRAKILFATVSKRAGRWWVSLKVEATGLHPAVQHRPRPAADDGGWVGIDRGLTAFAVAATADGTEVARITHAPKALATGISQQTPVGEIVVPQTERITQPRRCRRQTRSASSPRRQCASAFPAPGLQSARQDPRPARHRRPQHRRNAGQSSAGPRHFRCRLGRIRPPTALQASLARRTDRRG